MTHINKETLQLHLIKVEALLRPVPDMSALRQRKQGYGDVLIDTASSLFAEPIVDIAQYGIAGQAYYSRPNTVTDTGLPEVPKALFLRESVAKTLAALNTALAQSAMTQFFGTRVELYVEDALRPVWLQARLHDELIPRLLRKQYPRITNAQLSARRNDIIAAPSVDPKRPSPHATGGAFDITIRHKQKSPLFVANSAIVMGHQDGEASERINPDYFEYTAPITQRDKQAQRHRRAFYAIMTGAAFNAPTGFTNNPTEWWHWDRGDQLWAKLNGKDAAYYSFASDQDVHATQ